ncbi:unnamed protein product [Blepharisma stoltei]|uniref:Uncharacterized protein n=1 Tax=Blepharisma stoltei TaxID=1481888 RepID=A0AAU9IAQ9_9CILI|nr:unnamed protein product [Blepharisma stoltei]
MAKVLLSWILWSAGFFYLVYFIYYKMPYKKVGLSGSDIIASIHDENEPEDYISPNCTNSFCSWNYFYSNQNFSLTHTNFSRLVESADEHLKTLLEPNDPPLRCLPEKFGYTRTTAKELFPDVDWPTCAKKIGEEKQIIYIDPIENTLSMNCSNGKGWYSLGINPHEEMTGFQVYLEDLNEYKGAPITLKHGEEWAFGTCTEKKKTLFEGATYSLRRNQTAIERTQQKMKEMQHKAKVAHNSTETKPLTVIILIIDSLSRRHFYRKLPKTIEYLNSIDSSKFSLFDFKIHNVMGDNSLPNTYPVWTGKTLLPQTSEERHENMVKKADLIGAESIWHYLIERGWITLFDIEFCNNYMAYKTGRRIDTDHMTGVFWCAAERLSGYLDITETQRCIGNQNSHFYSLNNTIQFVNSYEGLNKWAHVTTEAGHEHTGSVISSLDDDLVWFLKKILQTKDELVLFMMGDHGMRYGDWYKLLEGSIEHKLPMLITLASNSLLDDIPNSYDSLYHNSNRLMSKLDLHRTLKHLAHVPYYRGYTKESPEYFEWDAETNKSLSLLLDKIPNDRSCQDINIEPFYCSCLVFTKIDESLYAGKTSLRSKEMNIKKLIREIAEYFIYLINEETVTPYKSPGFHICQEVTLKAVDSVEWLKLAPNKHFYKLAITVNEHPLARFESVALVTSQYEEELNTREGYHLTKTYLNGKKNIKPIYIRRQDMYGGLCEQMCNLRQILAPLCICHKLGTIEWNEPNMVEEIKSRYMFYMGDIGESCTEKCNKEGLICDTIGINVMNSCNDMKKVSNCKTCVDGDEKMFPGENNGVCYLQKSTKYFCDEKLENIRRGCACKGNS